MENDPWAIYRKVCMKEMNFTFLPGSLPMIHCVCMTILKGEKSAMLNTPVLKHFVLVFETASKIQVEP